MCLHKTSTSPHPPQLLTSLRVCHILSDFHLIREAGCWHAGHMTFLPRRSQVHSSYPKKILLSSNPSGRWESRPQGKKGQREDKSLKRILAKVWTGSDVMLDQADTTTRLLARSAALNISQPSQSSQCDAIQGLEWFTAMGSGLRWA
eukprot:6463511-Amphidinium_carterae.1